MIHKIVANRLSVVPGRHLSSQMPSSRISFLVFNPMSIFNHDYTMEGSSIADNYVIIRFFSHYCKNLFLDSAISPTSESYIFCNISEYSIALR